MRTLILAGAALLVAASGEAHAGLITIDSSTVVADARVGLSGPSDYAEDTSTAIPTNTTLTADADSSSSGNVLAYSEIGGQTILDFDMDHTRDGSANSVAQTYASAVNFTANAGTLYEITGFYNMTGSGNIRLSASLRDVTDSLYLFLNSQQSLSIPNQSFVLGETQGDSNLLTGNTTGNLIAGHQYELVFTSSITTKGGVGSASAVGHVNLTIGQASSVPAPSSLALFGMGIVGLGGARWRSKLQARMHL